MNGHPSARISWEEPRNAKIDFNSEPSSHAGVDHTRSIYHTITYRYAVMTMLINLIQSRQCCNNVQSFGSLFIKRRDYIHRELAYCHL